MENKKRERVGAKKVALVQAEDVQSVENVHDELDIQLEQESGFMHDDYILPNGEFDWDNYAHAFSRKLIPNHKVKTNSHKHIVYSSSPDAQDFYNMIEHTSFEVDTIGHLEVDSYLVGKLHSMTAKWATVDVNYREMLYIDLDKEDADVISGYRPGDEVTVKVLSNKTAAKEFVTASITEGARQAIFAELRQAADDGDTAFAGTVMSMIPGGGYIVKVQGIECFMPGSLAGINKLADFESIVGTEMYVVPDSFSANRGTIVVSHRAYLQAMIPNAIAKIEANLDTIHSGFVTGTAKFGVFCEFEDCLTGMIHINDLDKDWANKHKINDIRPGDAIEFKIKEVVSNKKIILTQVEKQVIEEDNSWEEFTKDLQIPSVINGKIRSVKDYGVFVGLHGSITGMAHVSGFEKGVSLVDLFSKGDDVAVEITKIDNDTKKVFLKVVGA